MASSLKRTISKAAITLGPAPGVSKKKSVTDNSICSTDSVSSVGEEVFDFRDAPEAIATRFVDENDFHQVEENEIPQAFALSPAIYDDRCDYSEVQATSYTSGSYGSQSSLFSPTGLFGMDSVVQADATAVRHPPTPSPFLMHYPTTTAAYSASLDPSNPSVSFLRLSLDYCQELLSGYDTDFSFGYVCSKIQHIPDFLLCFQASICQRLAVPFHMVGSFLRNVQMFICDADIREATTSEFIGFLRSLYSSPVKFQLPNLLLDIESFFAVLLSTFKQYLIKLWMAVKKIRMPCEFGARSKSLFLCMECHNEHY